jgi:hypothetical protein
MKDFTGQAPVLTLFMTNTFDNEVYKLNMSRGNAMRLSASHKNRLSGMSSIHSMLDIM